MRPLLWKEMRDLRMWVLATALSMVALELLIQSERFRNGFIGAYFPFLMPLLLTVAAVGLGAGQIARERHLRTLDYLLVRPVPQGVIVWMKFLAGTLALALLVAGIVGVGFVYREQEANSYRHVVQQIGFQRLALILFPRYWCAYALTLFFSLLVDRAAKVAALMAVVAIAAVALAYSFFTLAPFSSFGQWLPFIDGNFGLIMAAKSPSISWLTGLVYSAAAFLLAACSAALLRRSSERYVSNPGLVAIALGIAGAAVLSAHAASVRFPAVPPTGSLVVDETCNDFLASGSLVAVVQGLGVHFYDFSQPSKPHEVALVSIPQWTYSGAFSGKAAMEDDAVFLVGHEKALPVDLVKIACVKPSGLVEQMLLGPEREEEHVSQLVPVGRFLYVSVAFKDRFRLHVFDLASRQEVAALDLNGTEPVIARRGSYLYVATMSAMTVVDVTNPAKPLVASNRRYQPRFLFGLPRHLAWQGNRLYETESFPIALRSFDLSDPSRPVDSGIFEYHDGYSFTASSRALYRHWQLGLLEFRAEGDSLRTLRYLSGGERIDSVTTSGDSVFALTRPDDQHHRKIQAFR